MAIRPMVRMKECMLELWAFQLQFRSILQRIWVCINLEARKDTTGFLLKVLSMNLQSSEKAKKERELLENVLVWLLWGASALCAFNKWTSRSPCIANEGYIQYS